jgi:hypothetical protein
LIGFLVAHEPQSKVLLMRHNISNQDLCRQKSDVSMSNSLWLGV